MRSKTYLLGNILINYYFLLIFPTIISYLYYNYNQVGFINYEIMKLNNQILI